ncbi:NAD(P)-dependent dehydrogenase, short-chain alcohol dehydrogenase family [Rhizobium hainanense]|uniref:NAD(P)-dependent dehydrogenase, short-chain alcohol dehydrogenase family n=2 Tax=Rhizobium hainanense TaxID=52131 RepID=A0A1C3UBD6_9HYPH|nr:NAD(P)-dependent dehydrogenase, short-chain alcohol dehydrogenase family [Rhizobium hainanense]
MHRFTEARLQRANFQGQKATKMSNAWTPAEIPPQTDRRIIVTGGNSGIGWHTALELARAGAQVTIGARSKSKGEDAVKRIRDIIPRANVRWGVLDLSNPVSVQAFADSQLEDGRPIDMLINNAGIMGLPRREVSVDGHELQFATNVFGPYRLTGLLLPALLHANRPRVVTVASGTHKMFEPGPITDFEAKDSYAPMRVYAKTKLANVLFARELQRRAGDRLLSTISHPGGARTNLFAATTLSTKIAAILTYPLLQSSEKGAWPTLMAATLENARPGGYYGPGGFMELRGNPVEVKTASYADDPSAWRALFSDLERITGIAYAI